MRSDLTAASSLPGLRPIYVERHAAMAVRGSLVVVVWTGPVPIDAMRAQRLLDGMQRLRETTHKRLLLYAYLVADSAALPDAAARKIGARLVEHFDHCAGIHEGDGLRVSAVRAVLTSMTMMARVTSRHRLDVVADVPSAARALAPRSRGTLDEAGIIETIEATRRISLV